MVLILRTSSGKKRFSFVTERKPCLLIAPQSFLFWTDADVHYNDGACLHIETVPMLNSNFIHRNGKLGSIKNPFCNLQQNSGYITQRKFCSIKSYCIPKRSWNALNSFNFLKWFSVNRSERCPVSRELRPGPSLHVSHYLRPLKNPSTDWFKSDARTVVSHPLRLGADSLQQSNPHHHRLIVWPYIISGSSVRRHSEGFDTICFAVLYNYLTWHFSRIWVNNLLCKLEISVYCLLSLCMKHSFFCSGSNFSVPLIK